MKKFQLFLLCTLLFALAACSNSKQQIAQDDAVQDETTVDDGTVTQDDGPTPTDGIMGDELPTDGDTVNGDDSIADEVVTDDIATDDILVDEDGIVSDDDSLTALDCSGIVDCTEGCGGDTNCMEGCYNAGATEEQGKYDALTTCATTYCATECASGATQECQDCAVIHCTPEMNSCFDTATTLTCAQMLGCRGGCGGDQTCIDACVAAGSVEEQTAYNTLFACVNTDCATECGPSGTSQACETCVNANCAVEMNACYIDEEAPVYGTLAVNATFNYLYDGNSDIQTQIQANQSGLVMSSVFTGTYAASNKPIPPTAAQSQTVSLAMHLAATSTNPARVVAHMQVSTQAGIVNPIVQLLFPNDTITTGAVSMNAAQQGAGFAILLNSLGGSTRCLLAISFGGSVTVTAAANTNQTSGGSIAFNGTGITVYHPTESPLGDISDTNTCPKE